jgi:hypothetical protein
MCLALPCNWLECWWTVALTMHLLTLAILSLFQRGQIIYRDTEYMQYVHCMCSISETSRPWKVLYNFSNGNATNLIIYSTPSWVDQRAVANGVAAPLEKRIRGMDAANMYKTVSRLYDLDVLYVVDPLGLVAAIGIQTWTTGAFFHIQYINAWYLNSVIDLALFNKS